MTNSNQAAPLLTQMRQAVEEDLQTSFSLFEGQLSDSLGEMIAYHLGWTGASTQHAAKRVRPLLTLLTCDAAGGQWQQALPAASAIEFVHNFSLIHDDIEDQSETRRGRPTVWTRWGVAQAINAGDALFTISRLTGHRMLDQDLPPEKTLTALRLIDEACLKLTVGQQLDLAFEDMAEVSEETYLNMIEGKTSALLSASTEVGALLAPADPARRESYRRFGRHLGLAFQILDDILGIWGSPETMGKPAGDDLRLRKKSLPVVYGLAHSAVFAQEWRKPKGEADTSAMRAALAESSALEHARSLARRHTDLALSTLQEARPTGPSALELESLAQDLLRRDR